MPAKGGGGGCGGSPLWILTTLCVASFCVGALVTNRIWHTWNVDAERGAQLRLEEQLRRLQSQETSDTRPPDGYEKDILSELSQLNLEAKDLNETISSLKMELAAYRASEESGRMEGSPELGKALQNTGEVRQKAFVVVGINTGFHSQKRREALRSTWMPQGEKLRRLEAEKGIVFRFVIGRSGSSSSLPDLEIDAEDALYNDFLRLEHVEGYYKLTAKTKTYFATAFAKWDADFYAKVDDDIHVNPGTLATTLVQHVSTPRVYIGCMKYGPVLHQKYEKYHEPEFWKFGEKGNHYFSHATGQIYAISKDLAAYISTNQQVLHEYANEDVSLGSWLLGLDVERIDDGNMCCGTPPHCEAKARAGSVCAATFDWPCSGLCKIQMMEDVHRRCGEGEDVIWTAI